MPAADFQQVCLLANHAVEANVWSFMAQQRSESGTDLASIRDTVESIWVAIVLAFVLRAFMIEAFVIPTGSMAPRLMGEHWELTCDACRFEYAFGAPTHRADEDLSTGRGARVSGEIGAARCPSCGYPYQGATFSAPVSSGDRVLVLKYLYRFVEPQPWDVIVFKNPQNNRENYIKRLIGLPGETIEIVHGDIFVAPGPEGPWSIRAKPPHAQEAMWQVVYDNDYPPDPEKLRARGVTRRGWFPDKGAQAWELGGQVGRRFVFHGSTGPEAIRFGVEKEPGRPEERNRDILRAMFAPTYGYNRNLITSEAEMGKDLSDVCGDLKLSFVLEPRSPDTVVSLMTSSFNHHFKGQLKVGGEVALYYCDTDDEPRDDEWQVLCPETKIAPLSPGRGHEIALTHVDLTVTLWVDGEPAIQFGAKEYQERFENRETLKARIAETPSAPAGTGDSRDKTAPPTARHSDKPYTPLVRIAVQGPPCELSHVKLMRDVYYTNQGLDSAEKDTGKREHDPRWDYIREPNVQAAFGMNGNQGWGVTGHKITLTRHEDEPDLDEFYVLGDNSPQSLDSRAWTAAAPSLKLYDHARPLYRPGTVPRYCLLGRAMFVYWPAGFAPPGLPGLPIIPNVGRMRLIR